MNKCVERIYLESKKCVGCNKCLGNCPVLGANIAYIENGKNKIKIDPKKCIHCGECIRVCDQGARYYKDDTEEFFKDLKNGKKISIIAAPAIRINFEKHKKLFGYLKSLGVNLIFDVSFGAEITVWIYLKLLKENNMKNLITESCPPIVNYIQKYKPELIDLLAPVHSPMMNLAIYMRKYENIQDSIAFLSPCIAKADEIDECKGYIDYNVTFKKLLSYIKDKNIDLNKYDKYDFDHMGCALGFLFSKPGGLKENIELHLKDVWIRQISGIGQSYRYLNKYSENLKNNKELPLILDILNCPHGCNLGTGTCMECDNIEALDNIEHKLSKIRGSDKNIIRNKAKKIHKYFDENLNIDDFKKVYNRNIAVTDIVEPTEDQYNEIFSSMNKNTEESRNINCLACGYGSCKTMAKCIFNGLNIAENCIDYNKKEVINEHYLSEIKTEFFTNISHELRTPLNVIYSALQLEKNYYGILQEENIMKYNKIIQQNCLRLIRLVNNIIDLSKIDSGYFNPILKNEDIVSAVENMTSSINTYIKSKRMSLIFDTEFEELYLKCDINLMERIVLNLLSNAIKYGREGGTIWVNVYKSKRDNDKLIISVKDDGIGIPKDMQTKIFERFRKVDTSLSRKNEGSGIGLSLVKSLVEVQGGEIKCISKLNKGSEFLVIFPMSNEIDEKSKMMADHVLLNERDGNQVEIEFSDIYI